MKTLIATLSLAALIGPAVALADTTNAQAAPNAAQMQSRMAEFQQMHQRMEQLHTQARLQVLSSISAPHKTEIANLLGQLAISEKPDIDATARQINSLLTPAESQAVVRIHTQLRSQATALMEQMHSQMQRQAPPGAPQHQFKAMQPSNHPEDAGHLVMFLLIPGHAHGMMAPHPM
jgi:hypothetical protein